VINKLNNDINTALADPQVEKTMLAAGAEPGKFSADQFGKFIQEELNKWAQLEVAMTAKKKP
jgi:tripartite-type tricarboxylate transporter receptor subunit TctC